MIDRVHRIVACGALAVLVLAAGQVLAGADDLHRFRIADRLMGPTADWIASDGNSVAFGAGRLLYIAEGRPSIVLRSFVELENPVSDGVLVGNLLFVADDANRLLLLDLNAASPEPRPLDMNLRRTGKIQLTMLGEFLVVGESGAGIGFYRLVRSGHGAHAHHSLPSLSLVGFFALSESLVDLSASGNSVYALLEGGRLAEVNASDMVEPMLQSTIDLAGDWDSVTANGGRAFLLGPEGLRDLDLSDPLNSASSDSYADISGKSIQMVGRTLYVAGGESGLQTLADQSRSAVTVQVTAGGGPFAFNPAAVTIDVGDTVQWTNAGGVHNVRSCIPGQGGCPFDANENFFAGAPPFSSFSHTFVSAGLNPYVCQPHALLGMTGSVTVNAPAAVPPGVPDGTNGTPLLLDKLTPGGSSLQLTWDDTTCANLQDHHIAFAGGSGLPAGLGGIYNTTGGVCSLGPTSPFTWNGVPDPTTDPTNFIFMLLIADDSAGTQGSMGKTSTGGERRGPIGGASGVCAAAKDLSNACGQ